MGRFGLAVQPAARMIPVTIRSEEPNVAASLELLAAKAEIADLVHTYALHIRARRPERCGELFTDDGCFEVIEADPLDPGADRRMFRAEGREAVIASVGRSAATARVFPAIHNLIVEVDGDAARATSLMLATVFPGGGETIGEYADEFRRESGHWRFSARTYTLYRAKP